MSVRAKFSVVREDFTLRVDLTLQSGQVTAVVGPNGAGKTSFLRALAGLDHITDGELHLNERVVDDAGRVFVAPMDRAAGYVFQDYVLFPHLSVLENVAFGLRARGVKRKQARERANSVLDHFGIAELAPRRPMSLSGGQAQRVALARALATQPALLLLDEPLSAADIETKNELRAGLVARLAEFEGCCVVVTHDPLDALLLADRVIVLENGIVVQDDSPAGIAAHPVTNYVAALMNVNLIRGNAADGVLVQADGSSIHIGDQSLRGLVAAVIRPESVAVHREHPRGSARNVWRGVVTLIQPWEDKIRVHVQAEPSMIATITPGALGELQLGPGSVVWLSAKAVDIRAYPLA